MVDASDEPATKLTTALLAVAHKHPEAEQDINELLPYVRRLQTRVSQDARPLEEAPTGGPEQPLLLFCPEEGGWHVGVSFEGRWVDLATLSIELEPTCWMPLPPEPREDGSASMG